MKPALMKSLLLASLTMVMATGCGKKDAKAPAPAPAPTQQVTNPVTSIGSHLAGTALANFTELSAWYTSTTENDVFGIKETRSLIIYKPEACTTKTFLGIDFTSCSTKIESTTPSENYVVAIQNGGSKSSNPRLAKVFDGSVGKIIDVQFLDYNDKGAGGVYEVVIQKANGQPIFFQINTGYNSIFNPVRIKDPENRSEDRLLQISSY